MLLSVFEAISGMFFDSKGLIRLFSEKEVVAGEGVGTVSCLRTATSRPHDTISVSSMASDMKLLIRIVL